MKLKFKEKKSNPFLHLSYFSICKFGRSRKQKKRLLKIIVKLYPDFSLEYQIGGAKGMMMGSPMSSNPKYSTPIFGFGPTPTNHLITTAALRIGDSLHRRLHLGFLFRSSLKVKAKPIT